MKKTIIKCTIALIMSFNVFHFSLCRAQADLQIPIPNGKARIIFTRKWQLLGAAVPHYLIDRGTGVTFNTVVLQKKIHPDSKINSYGKNIRLFVIMDTSSSFIKIHKTIDLEKLYETSPNNTPDLFTKFDYNQKPFSKSKDSLIFVILPTDVFYRKTSNGHSYYINCQSVELPKDQSRLELNMLWAMKRNAFAVGNLDSNQVRNYNLLSGALTINGYGVKAGQTVIYDRSPGLMRLQVIVLDGTQIVAPSIEIEAGKTYRVNYYYAGSKFEISEETR